MFRRNRQTPETFFDQELPKVGDNVSRIELAQIDLDRQLPRNSRRNIGTVS